MMNGKKNEMKVYRLPKDGIPLLWWENMAMDNMELDKVMQFLIAEICNKFDGELYPNTLYALSFAYIFCELAGGLLPFWMILTISVRCRSERIVLKGLETFIVNNQRQGGGVSDIVQYVVKKMTGLLVVKGIVLPRK